MNSLSLHAVNASSSYEVSAVNDGCYQFFTDYGVHCTVEFVLDDSLLSHETYHLVIVNVNHQKSPSDVKVRDTIIAIIDEFFVENNTTLLYICETGDKKQALRNRLFERWFSTYKRKAQYTFVASSLKDEEGIENYTAIIVRNDNPELSAIIAEFTETISLLSSKP
jgi:hypothetical protein